MVIYDSQGRKINLTDKDFIAEGGEGRLFARRGKVYKVYLDRTKMIPADKMEELARLDDRAIVRPLETIYDDRSNRVGFSMTEVPNAIALPRLFTSSFWTNNSITPEKIADLVKTMQKTIAYLHQRGFLQVDGNEFNYLVNPGFTRPYFIDVDSYQTPSYPATAIMPSIRDYTQDGFNEGTDWFSFAIVAFQLFAGIHPFKGRHPDFRKGDFESRIKAGVSVLNSTVSYPSSVRDFSVIPRNYMEWFERLFERGERLPPPSGVTRIVVKIPKRIIRDTASINVKQINEYAEAITRFNAVNGQHVVRAGNTLYVGKRVFSIPEDALGVYLRDNGNPAFMVIREGMMGVMDADHGDVTMSAMEAERIFVAGNVPYIIRDDDLIEVSIMEMGCRMVISPGPVRKVLPNATTVFSNIVYEDVLGKAHLLIPVRAGEMPIVRTPELDGYKVVDARYQRGVAMFVVADRDGNYRQVRFRFDSDFTSHDVEVRDDVDDPMNFTVLDKGLIISIPRDGRLEVALAKPGNDMVREVDDAQIGGFLRLYNDGGRVLASSSKKIYAISLKP